MLAFQTDEGPSAKPRRISTMRSLVGRKGVPNDEASATLEIPGGIRFMDIMEEI